MADAIKSDSTNQQNIYMVIPDGWTVDWTGRSVLPRIKRGNFLICVWRFTDFTRIRPTMYEVSLYVGRNRVQEKDVGEDQVNETILEFSRDACLIEVHST